MACCGPSIPKIEKEELIKKLRQQAEEIPLDLNRIHMIFEPKKQRWNSNSLFIIYNLYNLPIFR
jgi:hypothetical protein